MISTDKFENLGIPISPIDVSSCITIKDFPQVEMEDIPSASATNTQENMAPKENIVTATTVKSSPISFSSSDNSEVLKSINFLAQDILELKTLVSGLTPNTKTPEVETTKSKAVFIIPEIINYPFEFIKFYLEGNLCVVVVDPKDFSLEVKPGTEVIINLPNNSDSESKFTSFKLKILSSKIPVELMGYSYHILLFWRPVDKNA